jgi:iron complex outermembrane receptor protein
MKKLFLLTALAVMYFNVFAQTNIKVTVRDSKSNQPIPKASVFSNSKAISIANDNGEFNVPANTGLITISSVGYISTSVRITNADVVVLLESSNYDLNAVEITATSNSNKALLFQPASITKLRSTELKRGTGLFLDDAINSNVPGVTMNRRAVSSGQQFNIRGYGNGSRGTRGVSSNFDGQGYKVYLNGIPVTDAEGISTLDDIDFGSIGNVEVVKGPSGTLYGLAIAGVVNLNTIKPEKGKSSIGQDILLGNYGLQRYTTQFQSASEHSSILLNYGHQKSDGFTIHNASRKNFVNLAGEFEPNAKQNISYYGGYSNSYDERSGELTVAQYESNDFSGNIEYIKRNAHSAVYTVRGGVGHTYNFTDKIANTTTAFVTAFNSNASSAGGWTDKAATNFGVRSTFDTRFNVGNNASLSGITGVESQRQNATTIGYGMIDPLGTAHVWKYGDPYFIIGSTATGTNGITSDIYTTTATTSVFTEWTLGLPGDLSITGGIGISNQKIALDDRFYVANKPTHYDTVYKGMVSPHFAINKVFSKQFSAYASYSTGYKAPVSSYFFIPYAAALGGNSGIINNHLKPEKGDQFEIGTKGNTVNGRLSYQLAFFNAIFSNKMTAVAVPNPNNTATLYTYMVNGGKQDNKGIEALLKWTAYESEKSFFKTISPFANMTYSDFKYKNFAYETGTTPANFTKVDYSGNVVPGVAKFLANVGVDVTTNPGLYANATFFYKDGVTVTSNGTLTGGLPSTTNTLYHAGSYSLLNAKVGFRHGFGPFDLDVYFAANNITENKYPIMIFVNQIPDAYVAGPKNANVFGGLNLKYNF